MDNLPRFAFYTTGILIVSVAFTLFTSELFFKMADPGFGGTGFLIGYGLVYMNIVFVSSRRFMRRLDGPTQVPYYFAFLVGIFPAIWIFIYQSGLDQAQQIMFAGITIFACGLGAYFGHKAGLKSQIRFQQQLAEYLNQFEQNSDNQKQN